MTPGLWKPDSDYRILEQLLTTNCNLYATEDDHKVEAYLKLLFTIYIGDYSYYSLSCNKNIILQGELRNCILKSHFLITDFMSKW